MTILIRSIFVLFLALGVAACSSEPTFDATNDQTMEASMEEMTKDMTEEEKMELGQAVMSIAMQVGFSSMGDEDKIEKELKDKLHGKTAEEIIEQANGDK